MTSPTRTFPTVLLVAAAAVVVAIGALLLANTADSDTKSKETRGAQQSPATQLKLALGEVHLQNTGPPAQLAPAVKRVVLQSAQSYVDGAILAPLETGRVDGTYADVFDPFVKRAASTTDRPALTEAGTATATGRVRPTASPVRLDGLVDPTGKVALVAATFTMKVQTPTDAGPLTIGRITELTFANEFGKWVVTAYNVSVRRTLNNSTTVTTARSANPGATP